MNINKPEPTPNNDNQFPPVWDLVLKDIEQREEMGIKKYGSRLRPFNNRNSLRDAYQEALDLVVYLRQKIYEEEGE